MGVSRILDKNYKVALACDSRLCVEAAVYTAVNFYVENNLYKMECHMVIKELFYLRLYGFGAFREKPIVT